MIDCVKREYAVRPPTSSASPASSTEPMSNDDPDFHTVIAPDLLSKYEMNFWYHGLSDEPPKLMWRSDLETNPFPTPPHGARFFTVPTKTAHGVFKTPLNAVWRDVAPKILESIKARDIKYSALQTVRFSTVQDGNETFGPVVVWISVHPNTTDARAVRDATPDILQILADAQITDVVVEWCEASLWD